MAINQFVREPIEGGDSNTWAGFLLPIVRDVIGSNTTELYDDSGVLKITFGRIGIDDNSNQGICLVEQNTTIDISGTSPNVWAQIQVEVVGVNLVFSALDMPGGSQKTLPITFLDSYDEIKDGFYPDATKRTIGLIWKNSGGTLKGVINTANQTNSYNGVVELSSGENYVFEKSKGVSKSYLEDLTKFSNFANTSQVSYVASSSWKKVTLDTAVLEEIPNINFNNSVITLTAGKYRLSVNIIGFYTPTTSFDFGIRVRNTTDGITEIKGMGIEGSSTGTQLVGLSAKGIIDLSSSKNIQIELFNESAVFFVDNAPNAIDVFNTTVNIERVG